MRCDYCGGNILSRIDSPATGYGIHARQTGEKTYACYACCAWLDVMAMREGQAPGLYFDGAKAVVTNWPGTLVMLVSLAHDVRGGVAGKATIVHFMGPDGSRWCGRVYHGMSSGNLLSSVRPMKGAR